MVLSWLALALTTLGYVDQGRERIAEAMSTADHLKQPYSRGFALVFACATAWTTGSAHEEQRYADELIALSTEHGFFYLLAFGRFHRGFALTTLGLPRDGLSAMAESLSMFQAIGAVTCTPWIFVMQADAYAKLGQPQEAFDCLAKAAKTIESTNERYTEPELHRVRGDLLNSTDDSVAAEKDYRLALAVAQRQSSKLCELRAATRLARLWRDQGKRIEARDLLAPVYGWFTEGFDTRDLKEAKALLGELMTTNSKATFLWPGTSVRRKAAVLPGSRCAPCYSCDASTARCGKMRRRQLIALLGGAAVAASPFRARAQRHERPRRLGVLMSNAESDPLGQARIAALRAGLRELGWSEGGNLTVDVRWVGSDTSRLNDYAAELVRFAPDVIVTNGTPGTTAAEQATRSIPIVFAVVNDPVEQGLIASLAHPGGNVTGLSFVDFPLFGKSLELLRQIAPTLTSVGLMFRPADHPCRVGGGAQ
jgi:tetratricopeptide (TPR) repeat protein